MSRAFTARPAVTATTPTTPQHTPDPKLDVRCQCGKKTPRLQSRSEKNPGRHFYACHKGFNDSERCKYFKWEDDLMRERGLPTPPTTGAARTIASMNTRPAPTATPLRTGIHGAGHTLGGSPAGSRPISAIPAPDRPAASHTGGPARTTSNDSIDDGLDDVSPQEWDRVDVVALESSPLSAKTERAGRHDAFRTTEGGTGSRAFLHKLQGKDVEEIAHTDDDEHIDKAQRVKRERIDEDDIVDDLPLNKSPRKVTDQRSSEWDQIRDDPNNPFHAHHAAAFPPTPITPDRRAESYLGNTTSMTEMSTTSRSSARASDVGLYAGHAILGGVANHINMLERKTSEQEERIHALEEQLKKQSRQMMAKIKTEEFLRSRLHAAESRARELQGVLEARSQS